MNDRIIIMAKNPFRSKVKTRLAKTTGEEAARGIYARLLYDMLSKLLDPMDNNIRIELSLSDKEGINFFTEAFPEFAITKQCTGNIGVRMQHAFKHAFQNGAERVVLIGTDIPGINWSILIQAFNKIDGQSIVIGPTKDGGYYLVGMGSPGINIFKNIPWSSPEVFHQTIKNIKDHGFQPFILSELVDIDNEMDLKEWHSILNKGR